MSASVTWKDGISPVLRQMAQSLSDRKPILLAMGQELVSVTKLAFNDENYRPQPWPALRPSTLAAKGNKSAMLKRSAALWQSIRIAELSNESVTVGTDRPYAVFHQIGTAPYTIRPSVKRALAWPGGPGPRKKVAHPGVPPRPFFPFTAGGQMVDSAKARIERVGMAKLRALLARCGARPK